MPVDFKDIVAKGRTAHEQRIAGEEARRAAERDARSMAVDAAVAALEEDVLPLLERARADFAEEGIETKIEREFDVKRRAASVNPCVSFRCLGPRRASDGYQPSAPAIFLSSDGKVIYASAENVAFDNRPHEELGTARRGESAALVARAVERAVDVYFKEMDQWLSIPNL